MTPEDIKKLFLPLARMIADLRAAENAKLHVLIDLHSAGFVSPEAAASRRTTQFQICSNPQFVSKRALARGSSSCSR
jgi:hypothetical protein